MTTPLPKPGPGGFTLVETLVALVMASLLFVGLYGVFRSALDAVKGAQDVSSLEETGRLATAVIKNDLLSLLQARTDDATDAAAYALVAPGQDATRQDAEGDILVLSCITGAGGYFTDGGTPDVYEVTYLLRPRKDKEDRYLLIRRELASPFVKRRDDASDETDMVLADEVVALSFRFESVPEGFLDAWDGQARIKNDKSALPRSISFSLGLEQNGRSGEFTSTTVLLPDEIRLR